jgi:hypothetical protein
VNLEPKIRIYQDKVVLFWSEGHCCRSHVLDGAHLFIICGPIDCDKILAINGKILSDR